MHIYVLWTDVTCHLICLCTFLYWACMGEADVTATAGISQTRRQAFPFDQLRKGMADKKLCKYCHVRLLPPLVDN